jgi:hypothetical protein
VPIFCLPFKNTETANQNQRIGIAGSSTPNPEFLFIVYSTAILVCHERVLGAQ